MVKQNLDELAISADECAELLGVSRATFYNMVKAGRLPKGDGGAYRLVEVIRAYVANASDDDNLTAQKTRLTRAQADKAELELDTMRGKLLKVEDVKKIWSKEIINAKSKLLSMASKLAPQLVGLDAATIGARIKAEVTTALGELKDGVK